MHRIILFDIDGTLVSGGPAKSSFIDAMHEVYGTAGDFENVSFAGKTDPQIVRELLKSTGTPENEIEGRLEELLIFTWVIWKLGFPKTLSEYCRV